VGDETPGAVVVLVVDDGGGAVVVREGTVDPGCTGDLGRVALGGVDEGGVREDSDAARS